MSDYDPSKFNPYFFGGSEMGSHKSPGKMSKEVEDRLYGRTPHMCTRLCSVHHFGKRVYPPKAPPMAPEPKGKRAVSVAYKPTYTDRSLSPLRLSEGATKNHRRLAENVNKDWALSEIYQYVKQKSQGKGDTNLEEIFK